MQKEIKHFDPFRINGAFTIFGVDSKFVLPNKEMSQLPEYLGVTETMPMMTLSVVIMIIIIFKTLLCMMPFHPL
jgi:hypothetical protein